MHPSWTMDDPHSCKRWFHSQKAKNIKSSVVSVLFDSPWWCFVTFWNEFCSFILQRNRSNWLKSSVWPAGVQGSAALPTVSICDYRGELHSFLKIIGISSSGFPFSHFYQIRRQNHGIFMTIHCWPDNKTELPKPTCWLAGLCQSWKCLGFTSKRQFGVYNACEKSEVETHLYLPLLEYDKIDTNSYQMIGVASKRGWLLPTADLLGLLAPRSPGMPVRIAETAWPWRTGCFVLLAANHRHAHGTCQGWLMAEVQSWIPSTGRGSLPGRRWTALGPDVPFPEGSTGIRFTLGLSKLFHHSTRQQWLLINFCVFISKVPCNLLSCHPTPPSQPLSLLQDQHVFWCFFFFTFSLQVFALTHCRCSLSTASLRPLKETHVSRTP